MANNIVDPRKPTESRTALPLGLEVGVLLMFVFVDDSSRSLPTTTNSMRDDVGSTQTQALYTALKKGGVKLQ